MRFITCPFLARMRNSNIKCLLAGVDYAWACMYNCMDRPPAENLPGERIIHFDVLFDIVFFESP